MTLGHNPILSIAIPTYNRSDFLEYSLETHIPLLQKYNIQIFISDNASSDDTLKVIEKWKKVYPHLHYQRNLSNLGPDENFKSVLQMSNTEYTWLLGDTSEIHILNLEKILGLISGNEKYDAILVNLINKSQQPSLVYQERNSLLKELAGIMSCMSCLIYHKSLISSADFSRYSNSWYIQTGIILERISRIPFKIRWIQEISITPIKDQKLKKVGWADTDKIFKVGIEGWINFIFSLPISYSLSSKLIACKGFGDASGAFTIKGMILLRSAGLLNYKVYKYYRETMRLSISYPCWIVMIISLIPQRPLKYLITVYMKASRHEKF